MYMVNTELIIECSPTKEDLATRFRELREDHYNLQNKYEALQDKWYVKLFQKIGILMTSFRS